MKKEEITKIYQKYKFYIFPIIVAVSSLILIITVIYPQTVKLFINQKVQSETLTKSNFLEAKAQSLEEIDEVDLSRKVDYVLGAYPTDKELISAIGAIQNITSQAGFVINSITLGASGKNVGAQSYNLKLDLAGSPALISILLNGIENSPRLMRVNSIDTFLGKDPKGAIIALNIDVLYSSAPQTFGSVDSILPSLSEKDEEVIAKLARVSSQGSLINAPTSTGTTGKANPFE